MDDILHPLVVSTPPPKGPINSPAPLAAEEVATDLRAHRDSMSMATTQFEQAPATSKAFRERSKSVGLGSYAWTLNSPRLPIDYVAPVAGSSVPYKARSWEPTLETAIKAIVSIKASHVRSFDTETSGNIFFFFLSCFFFLFIYSVFVIRWLYRHRVYCRCRKRNHLDQPSCCFTSSYYSSSSFDKLRRSRLGTRLS